MKRKAMLRKALGRSGGFAKYQSAPGFAPILMILVIAILVVAGYFGYKNYWPKIQPSLTPTASQAPNGDLANWKTYVDKLEGFSFRYPLTWKVLTAPVLKEDKPQDIIVIINSGSIQEVINKKGLSSVKFSDSSINNLSIKKGSALTVYDNEIVLITLPDAKILSIEGVIGLDENGSVLKDQVEIFNQILSTFKFLK